jgi:hypothetical protein
MKAKELKEALSHIDDDTNVGFTFTDDYTRQNDDMKGYYLHSITTVIGKEVILNFHTNLIDPF